MLVRDVMSRVVATIEPTESAEHARVMMQARAIHHLVVAEGDQLLGVVSHRDLGGTHGDDVCAGRVVRDLMISDVICGAPEMTLPQAAARMRARSIGCLPVLEGGKLVGILTRFDLLEAIERAGWPEFRT